MYVLPNNVVILYILYTVVCINVDEPRGRGGEGKKKSSFNYIVIYLIMGENIPSYGSYGGCISFPRNDRDQAYLYIWIKDNYSTCA